MQIITASQTVWPQNAVPLRPFTPFNWGKRTSAVSRAPLSDWDMTEGSEIPMSWTSMLAQLYASEECGRKCLRVPVPHTAVTSHPTCCHFIEVQINVTASLPVSAAIFMDYRWLHLLYHAISINTKSDMPQMRLNGFVPKPTELTYCLLSTKATSYIK